VTRCPRHHQSRTGRPCDSGRHRRRQRHLAETAWWQSSPARNRAIPCGHCVPTC